MTNAENQQKKDTAKEYLQSLYQTSLDTKYWENNKYFTEYREFCEEYENKSELNNKELEPLFELTNPIASVKGSAIPEDDFKVIKENFKNNYTKLVNLKQDLNNDSYINLKKEVLNNSTQQWHGLFNRIISTYFPGIVTNYATIKMYDDVLNYVSKKIPKLETYKCGNNNNNWFKKNNGLINYFTERIPDLKDPIHKTFFLNYLYDYFNIIMYKNLLKTNKNLILTGAPGTGKTYLAKEIAKAMIGVGNNEKLEDNEQYDFVQFHPSYDYTDFVEGLRPTQPDENGNIGFELKEGIFKEFCKRAAENIEDSEKKIDVLKKEKKLEKKLSKFIAYVGNEIAEKGSFEIKGIGGNKCAPIVEIDTNKFSTQAKNGKKLYKTPLSIILKTYDTYVQHKNITWTYDKVREKLSDQYYATYIYGFLKAFDEFLDENPPTASDEIVEEVKRKNFVFIIDEINRGEISKIFGELFFSIDPSYRGKKGEVKTQYANLQDDGDIFKSGFYVPENVYIIGTMNDIDRSVESFDFAMRRRFAWKEIKATDRIAMWDGKIDKWKVAAETKMNALNKKIEDIPGLSPAFHIGPAYFLHLEKYNGDFDQLWENHLSGLLFEYLRGMPDHITLLGELKKAYDINPEKKADDHNSENEDNTETEQ